MRRDSPVAIFQSAPWGALFAASVLCFPAIEPLPYTATILLRCFFLMPRPATLPLRKIRKRDKSTLRKQFLPLTNIIGQRLITCELNKASIVVGVEKRKCLTSIE